MVEKLLVRVFGKFRKLAADSSVTADSVVTVDYIEGEIVGNLLNRMGIEHDDIGELFVNHTVAGLDTVIEDSKSRVSIFPIGMVLLCGGQHLKGHGYITKKKGHKVDYY